MTWKKKRPEAVPVSMESVRAPELHTLLVKLAYQIYEMIDAAAQLVEFPDDECVTFA